MPQKRKQPYKGPPPPPGLSRSQKRRWVQQASKGLRPDVLKDRERRAARSGLIVARTMMEAVGNDVLLIAQEQTEFPNEHAARSRRHEGAPEHLSGWSPAMGGARDLEAGNPETIDVPELR